MVGECGRLCGRPSILLSPERIALDHGAIVLSMMMRIHAILDWWRMRWMGAIKSGDWLVHNQANATGPA